MPSRRSPGENLRGSKSSRGFPPASDRGPIQSRANYGPVYRGECTARRENLSCAGWREVEEEITEVADQGLLFDHFDLHAHPMQFRHSGPRPHEDPTLSLDAPIIRRNWQAANHAPAIIPDPSFLQPPKIILYARWAGPPSNRPCVISCSDTEQKALRLATQR